METIKEFAERWRVNTKRDGCGEEIIPGKQFCKDMPKRVEYRSHVYEHGDGRYGLMLLFTGKRKWTAAKQKLAAAGFTRKQNGDTEGAHLFDPANASQVRLAFRLAGIKFRRVVSEAVQRAQVEHGRRLAAFRRKQEGHLPALESTISPVVV